MERLTAFDALSDQYGFFVAYPESAGSAWDFSGTNNDFQFTLALLQTIEAEYHINPTRVYLAGYSQGVRVAQGVALCNVPLVAGLGDIDANSSHRWNKDCKATLPITYVHFHGTADPIIPYNGTLGSYSALQTTTLWAQANGGSNFSTPAVSSYPDTLNTGAAVVDALSTWSGCGNGTTVAFYTITGGGHTWPGGNQFYDPLLGPASKGTNASLILWQTFASHSSPAAFAGVCGATAGIATSSVPSEALCRTGIASTVTSGSGCSWTCSGYNGGAPAKCSAPAG
ncbi:MAG: hypothetical protein JSR21_22675 [Proteobacteria bacterium]|nr:hypothetical protein [Pseudomonadota bacterium]